MNSYLLPYVESLELKQLGFDEICLTSYDPMGKLVEIFETAISIMEPSLEDCYTQNSNIHKKYVAAPLFDQAITYFEDKYSIFIEKQVISTPNEIIDIMYNLKSYKFSPIPVIFDDPFDCFNKKKAELKCIQGIIKIIKNGNKIN